MICNTLGKFQIIYLKRIVRKNLHKPLTQVPDPFNKFNSFGEHNNEMLKTLDNFNFNYNFKSSTFLYKSGFFNSSSNNFRKL